MCHEYIILKGADRNRKTSHYNTKTNDLQLLQMYIKTPLICPYKEDIVLYV